MTPRARIAYAGSPDFAVPALEALLASRHEVVTVLTQPDKPAGRGRQLRPCPVKVAAEAAGLPVLQPVHLRESLLQARLQALTLDFIVVAAYGQILPPEVLAIPRVACLNLHASLLPRWRGASPIQSALLAGDEQTGVCLMQMERGLDTGPVYSRLTTAISASDTGGGLHDRLARLGAELLARDIDAILDGTLLPVAQPDAGVSHAPLIRKADGRIDWRQPARDIDCRIRAFNPWPVAFTTLGTDTVRCWMSSLARGTADQITNRTPGCVAGVDGDALLVQTGDGLLRLEQLQLPGRKPVSGREFANGRSVAALCFDAAT